jgi:hypothetical protein
MQQKMWIGIAVLVLLAVSVLVQFSFKTKLSEDKNEILNVVHQYIDFSFNGDFNRITKITISRPRLDEKEQSTTYGKNNQVTPAGKRTIIKSNDNGDFKFKWINVEFPQNIFDQKLQFKSVYEMKIEGNQAKVLVIMGNSYKISLLPWAFLLSKESDGSWKIFDITTPSGAMNFPPDGKL